MIWFNGLPALEMLNNMRKGNLGEHLGIEFVKVDDQTVTARMPVDHRTVQPFGLLHGGASAALAETVGSVAAWLCVNPEKQACVGIEINCNHLKGKRNGWVYATARPFHIGASTQVWEIRIEDEKNRLVCISRLTLAVVRKPIT
ncbi:MAG TPA: hotdog fold thioesterase [Edaphocola sp.]|nr:hotdog fold thioesterase [Edaphocola sp.]